MFHSFFSSLSRSWYLSLFSLSFSFTLWSAGTAKSTIRQVLFIFFFYFVDEHEIWPSDRDQVICLYLKILEKYAFLIFHDGFWVAHIPFVHVVKFKLLRNSVWITSPTQVCLVLYSFCVNQLIIWLIASSLSPQNQHLIFSSVLSIFALT